MTDDTILIIPGLGNSGADHWQTQWEHNHPQCKRVIQRDWDLPRCADWVRALDRYVSDNAAPIVLVAHSLGCAAVAHWAAARSPMAHRVVGALLVAPADVDSAAHTPAAARDFSPMPLVRLPFRSTVVASTDDPFVALVRAQQFAQAWGSKWMNIGAAGHINAQAGIGVWTQGWELLAELRGGE